MRVSGVVVLKPAFDHGQCRMGVTDDGQPNVVALEGLHEGLRHAVALRTFDGREAGLEVQRHSDVDGLLGREDRTVVGQPLHPVRGPLRAKAAFNALNHHVADHLARDA